MFNRIKQIFITLGIASGMTAGALYYYTGVDQCQTVVLRDLEKHRLFSAQISDYVGAQDFLTTLTKGK